MPPALWSVTPLITVVTGLTFLAAAATLWMLATRQMKMTRSETEQRLQKLTQRLFAIESRIDKLENHGRVAFDDHAKLPGHAAPGETKHGLRTQSFLDVREAEDARNEPTLITIPNLGAVEQESEGRAASELAERHGEVWTLAAAEVPPEEIARQTGQPIGQIELIVGLYRRLHSSRGSMDHARSR
jgi:hypothetical protein